MKILILILSLGFMVGCGKSWRSNPKKQAQPEAAAPGKLDPWSGRSDSIDTRWQIKNQP